MRVGNCILCGEDFNDFEGHLVERGPKHMTEEYCISVLTKRAETAEGQLREAIAEIEAQAWRANTHRDTRDAIAKVLYKHGCPSLNIASPQALEWLDNRLTPPTATAGRGPGEVQDAG